MYHDDLFQNQERNKFINIKEENPDTYFKNNLETIRKMGMFEDIEWAKVIKIYSGQYKNVDFTICQTKLQENKITPNEKIEGFFYSIKCNSKLKNLTIYNEEDYKKRYPDFLRINITEGLEDGVSTFANFDKDGNLNLFWFVPFIFFKTTDKLQALKITQEITKENFPPSSFYQHFANISTLINIMQDFENRTNEEIEAEGKRLKKIWLKEQTDA